MNKFHRVMIIGRHLRELPYGWTLCPGDLPMIAKWIWMGHL